jgi:hypothetical protein
MAHSGPRGEFVTCPLIMAKLTRLGKYLRKSLQGLISFRRLH